MNPHSPWYRRISLGGIALGLAVDIGGSLIIGILAGIILAVYGSSVHLTPAQIIPLQNSESSRVFQLFFGCLFSLLGGAALGLIAKPNGILISAAILALIDSSFGFTMLAFSTGREPLWFIAVGFVGSVTAILFGAAFVWYLRRQEDEAPRA